MSIAKNKIAAIAIAVFLTLTIAITLVALPPANAVTVGHVKTYPFLGATPNPVGVGQETLLHIGITEPLQITEAGWSNLTVTVTTPNNTVETLGPFRTDATGGTGTIFVPAMAGTYKLQTHFPAQWYNFSGYNLYYEASDSAITLLNVTSSPVPQYPGVPLPTEYWTRPIDAQAREWSVIGGNWLGVEQFTDTLAGYINENNDYAPETAHVLWTKPIESGGLAGVAQDSIFGGDAYEGKFSGSVIIDGVLFYNKYNTIGSDQKNPPENYVVAVDLHTGEELWSRTLKTPDGYNRTLSFGQVMEFTSFNVQGCFAYLWTQSGTRMDAFDPTDGRWLFTFTNVPSGTTTIGPNGELLIYSINQAAGFMTMWNSTAVIDAYWGTTENSPMYGSWRPQGKTINAVRQVPVTGATPLGMNGYQWNKTITKGLPGSASYYVAQDIVVGYSRSTYTFGGASLNNAPYTIWALNLKPGHEGELLYNKTYAAPPGNITVGYTRVGVEDRVFVLHMKEDDTNYCYNLDTGDYMWGPTQPPEYYLSYLETWTIVYKGRVYTFGTKGIVDCYNATTGEKLWSYAAADPLGEIKWSNNWNIRVDFIADGKIYLRHSAHSDNQPLPRGAPSVCLNASTGEVIWRVNGLIRGTDWGGQGMIGDSIIARIDTYDLLIFALGKGPSATTVTAPDMGIQVGSTAMIKGTVTDVSPGTQKYALTARFSNGVPAVSDESMSDWMLYLYKQFPLPSNATGVSVTLDAIDPNNNFVHLGQTTSDASGTFGLAWKTPDIPGKYTIIATFAGSKSYYASYAETSAFVTEAPPASPTPTPAAELPPIETYFVVATVVIIVAIAIVGWLLLRKQQ